MSKDDITERPIPETNSEGKEAPEIGINETHEEGMSSQPMHSRAGLEDGVKASRSEDNATNEVGQGSSARTKIPSSEFLMEMFNEENQRRLEIVKYLRANGIKLKNEKMLKKEFFASEEVLEKFGERVYDLCHENLTENKKQPAYLISIKPLAYLFVLHSITCLVIESKVFVLDVKAASAVKPLSSILGRLVTTKEKNMRAKLHTVEKRAATEQSKDIKQESSSQSVELTLLEVLLVTAFFQMDLELAPLLKEYTALSEAPVDDVRSSTFERIKKMKEDCQELKSKAKAVYCFLEELRDNEAPLNNLDLNSRFSQATTSSAIQKEETVEADESSEPRSEVVKEVRDMLRLFIHQSLNIKLEAKRLFGHACNYESSGKLTVAILNYETGKIRVRLSVGALVAACGAFLAALFGMKNKESESDFIHWIFISCLVLVILFLFLSHVVYAKDRRSF